MAMYAIAITPLIHHLNQEGTKQVWFADDATAGGSLKNLKAWWDQISELGRGFGYHPNAVKTWLVTKESHLERATEHFNGTGISIIAEGRRHLGAHNFTESCVKQKVAEWITMVERLTDIATSQPPRCHQTEVPASSHRPECFQRPGERRHSTSSTPRWSWHCQSLQAQ